MQNWIQLTKALVRPFIIVWGFTTYGVCVLKDIAVPDLLAALIAAAIIEYFGERAVLRLRTPPNTIDTKGAQ